MASIIFPSKYKNIVKKDAWPEWWGWEIEFTPHLLKRMEDRGFDEAGLSKMLERSNRYRKDVVEGRWIIETRYKRHPWEIIVEPDEVEKLLVIVTAYPVWSD